MINDKMKNKVIDFLDNKGFYVVLLLCVGIITLTAFVVTRRNIASYMSEDPFDNIENVFENPNTDARLALNEEIKTSDVMKKLDENIDRTVVDSKKTDSSLSSNQSNDKKSSVSATEPKLDLKEKVEDISSVLAINPKDEINFILPVQGDIIKEYAKDKLLYSKTLEKWTTHEGIDIGANRGVPVKAAYEGIVTDVYNDTAYGITVLIDHGNGIQTKYSNLSTNEMAQKGLKLRQGDVIGGVGNTALFESLDKSHIHFEVLKNGLNINPNIYIK